MEGYLETEIQDLFIQFFLKLEVFFLFFFFLQINISPLSSFDRFKLNMQIGVGFFSLFFSPLHAFTIIFLMGIIFLYSCYLKWSGSERKLNDIIPEVSFSFIIFVRIFDDPAYHCLAWRTAPHSVGNKCHQL